jgi:hypothetical protein
LTKLDSWLKAAMERGILALQNLAAGLEGDKAAVAQAITL